MLMKPQVFYDNNLKQARSFQNPFYLKKAQQIRLMLYDGTVIAKETNVISIADSEETLMLEEESRSKMLLKQRKGFCHNSIKNDLRKLKGKDIVDNVVQASNATTIAPGMYKLDPVTLAPKDKNNREAHIYYLKHTMEQDAILREIVKQAKSLNPLNSASYCACKYVKMIQELLGYVRDTCLDIHKPRVSRSTKSSRSKSTDNKKNDRILQISSSAQKKKNKVEDHSRIVNFMFYARHELCFLEYVSDINACSKSKSAKKAKKKEEWKPTGKVFTKIRYNWRPTGRTFTLVGNACPLTRITATNEVPLREPNPLEVGAQKPVETKVYTRKPKVVQIVLWYLDSGCSKHMTVDRSELTNFVHKFLGTVKFDNDQIAKIIGYDLEVAFRKHTCFVHNLEGVDLLSGSRETNLYTLSIGDMMASSPICLLSKASKTKSWLWHRRLSHLNFGVINHLAKNGLCTRINGKKYILVIMDDYSRFTWVKFLASKDEAPDFIIKFLKMIQVRLNANVKNIRTDNGTEFVNQTLCSYYESVGISRETSVARTQQC
ncbi:retrovirus-related pol polyprotein from transposon TNT 1-94 [Tanacetum coccineum]